MEELLESSRCLITLVLSIAATFIVFGGIAGAEAPRLIPDGQFESEGALGVGVDQSTSESDASRGDAYVAGYVTFRKKPGTGELELVFGRVNKFDAAGGPLLPSPVGETVAYSGAVVNSANGDVYALDAISGEIHVYDPTSGGAQLSSFSVMASGNFTLESFGIPTTVVGIAADSAGNVYVPVVSSNEVLEYDPATCPAAPVPEPCVPLKTFTGGSGAGALKGPTGVAVDPAGNVWVADAGNSRIVELSPADTLIREINSEGVQSVAVDAHGDVFAIVHNGADFCGGIKAPCSHLVEYSAAGAQVADLGASTFGALAAKETAAAAVERLPDMVAVNGSTGRVYVTEGMVEPPEGVHSRVFKFTPSVAPKLEGEVAVEVGVSAAKLGAVVSPGGVSAAYRFEYGTTEAYGSSVPFPEGDTGGGFASRSVWASASGLLPGTTYHYRVVVTGALGAPVVGKDQTFTTKTAAQAACPNDQLRTGFSASLPDCRAYELVTPPNKTSAQPDPNQEGEVEPIFSENRASVDGNRFSFKAKDVLPGSKSAGVVYVATRGASGWTSENVLPPINHYRYKCQPQTVVPKGFSPDLSRTLIVAPSSGGDCGVEPELMSGEPRGVENAWVRDNTNGTYQLVDVTPEGVTPATPEVLAASDGYGRIVFREAAPLTPDALGGGVANLYEWSGGVVRLLKTLLPDRTPVAGELTEPRISRDGSRIFFTYAGALYAQGAGGTVQLDASQAGGTGGGGGVVSVSVDGSHVLLSDDASAGLTADTVQGSGANLYSYAFASGRLADLTPKAARVEVRGVTGVSEDLSHVYFQALGVLATGGVQGQLNSYLWNAGTTTLIPALGRASANGEFQVIASSQRLTGYDNTDANTGKPDGEIYLYSAATNTVVCASCNPSGQRPTGGGAGLETRAPRNVSDNGQVFFDSSEALLPADTNGKLDVYEFEPDGAGNCADPGGCLSLLSTGTGSLETFFIEASPSGNDVFLREYQKLVPRDTQEEAQAIYDVRADGGIPAPPPPPACTTAEACRTAPAPQPSIFGAPASQTFSGVGNLTPPAPAVTKCKKGYVKKKSKCVRSKKNKKATKKTNRKGRR
jgi:NHL repeat